jgi:hypothetical protein
MRILLIGNFSPPYEEESLHNITFLKKLEEDGHDCTVINIAERPATQKNFIDGKNYFVFLFTLLRACWNKDVLHFFTKGYLRMGLLMCLTSILIGTLYRIRTFITIHSELFSIAGQMRSSLGGRQTLFTAFAVTNKLICADKDTFDVAATYMKKNNFELIPSFIYLPEDLRKSEVTLSEKLSSKEKVIVFSNMQYPSFAFEILNKFLTEYPLPADTAIVVALTEKPSSELRQLLEKQGQSFKDNLFIIESDDLNSVLTACSRAHIILHPLSCDGTTFFESFAVSVKKTLRSDNYLYFPNGLLFIKEGDTSEMCACIINTLLCVDSGHLPEVKDNNSYQRIVNLYQGKD